MLDVDIKGGTGALIHISGGSKLTLRRVHRIVQGLTEQLDVDANVKFGVRTVDADYEKYLAYVRRWRDGDTSDSQHNPLLQSLYDQKATQSIPLSHRRALLVQERMRTLMGISTWSAETGGGVLAQR